MKKLFLLTTVALLAFTTLMAADVKPAREQSKTFFSFGKQEMKSRQDRRDRQDRPDVAFKSRAVANTITTNLLDSIITVYSDGSYDIKEVFAYDEYGNRTVEAYYNWNWDFNTWEGNHKEEYTYDANGNQTMYAYYRWEFGQWIGHWKSEYEFDAYGNSTKYTSYDWDGNDWVVDYIDFAEYEYDADGNFTMRCWYSEASQYYPAEGYKYEGTFYSEEFPLNVTTYSYLGNGIWEMVMRIRCVELDTYGHPCLYYLDDWDTASKQWIESQKIEFAWGANGENPTLGVFYFWESGQWVGDEKYESTYDDNGNEIRYIEYSWESGQWVEYWKSEYTYDANGNETMSASYHWESGQWVGNYKSEYTYDANGNLTMYTHYYWESGQWVESSSRDGYEYTYNTDGSVAILRSFYVHEGNTFYGSTSYYYYSAYELLSSVNTPHSASLVQVYPNPVVNTLYINVEKGNIQAKLYNQQGQLLLQTNDSQINFSTFPTGIYILDVNGERMKVVK